MSELRWRRFWLVGGIALVCFVIVLCLLPAPTIAPVSRLLPDKVEHATAYVALSVWFAALYPRRDWWKLALALCVLGGAIEVAQGMFTTTRQADIRDEMANCAGILLGLAAGAFGADRWARMLEWTLGAGRDPK